MTTITDNRRTKIEALFGPSLIDFQTGVHLNEQVSSSLMDVFEHLPNEVIQTL